MKKRLISSILAVLTLVPLFTGCGNTKSTTEDIVTKLDGSVTIEMWHYLTGAQGTALQGIIDDFNQTNKQGITVKAINQGNIGDLNKKVIAAAQSNTLPAIINVYPDLATGLISQDKIADLSPYINDSEVGMASDLKDDFIKSFIDEVSQWDSKKIYGIPLTKSTEVLFVNKTKLEELGYTMDDLNDLTMDKLTDISKKSKEQLGIPGFGFDSLSNAFISTLKMDGKDFIELDGTINIDNDWVKSFMDYYRKNVEAGYFRIPGEDKFLSGPFSNEKLLMYQGSSAGTSHINAENFAIGVAQVPKFEGKKEAVIQQGASLFVSNNVSAQEKYAAYEFIKFATNTENTAEFAIETGYLPVRKSAEETTIMKNVLNDSTALYSKVFPVANKSLDYAYYTPAINNAQSARTVVQEKFEAYVTGVINNIDDFINETLTQVKTTIERQ